jgi:hypothetical protein
MSLQLLEREIRRIHVIDDDPDVRGAYLEYVQDMDIEGIDVAHSISDIDSFFKTIDGDHDGIICDYQLTGRKYSSVNGDVYGKAAYERKIPFLLSSHFQPLSLYGQRRFIPKAVAADDFSAEAIKDAFVLCLQEFKGSYSAHRQPIRTLVRIEGIQPFGASYQLNVVVPNWNPHVGVQIVIEASQIPSFDQIRSDLDSQGEARLLAEVNTGAEAASELFFTDWRSL